MLQLQQRTELWKDTGLHLVAISFEASGRLSDFASEFPAEWTFISDPDRRIYATYELGSAPWTRVYAPRTIFYYLRAKLRRLFGGGSRGKALGAERNPDHQQMGGDFLVDAAGLIRYAHPSIEPADRPSPETLQAWLLD